MAEELNVFLQELKSIRTYLIKIGPSRRVGNILEVKRIEANNILVKYNEYIGLCKNKIALEKIKTAEITLIKKICEEFDTLYKEVLSLCKYCETTERQPCSESDGIMASEKFDLKIALSILPVMTNDIENTKQLIEGIEYYKSVLNDKECHKKLIQFVLKSRLSQQAKLKLLQNYDSVDELIKDMKKKLLPQKSHTALQSRLLQCRQNNRSVLDFGKEISELFADLTISQADGDTLKYNILRPLNEKMAIKRFSDGLRNGRLSTVIAARNYDSLTDAIQAAQDEEINSSSGKNPPTNEGIMGMHQRPYYYRSFQRRPQGGQYTRQRTAPGYRSFSNRSRGHQQPYGHHQVQFPHTNFRGNRVRSNRSRSFSRGRSQAVRSNINFMATADRNVASDDPQMESLSHFFRE